MYRQCLVKAVQKEVLYDCITVWWVNPGYALGDPQATL